MTKKSVNQQAAAMMSAASMAVPKVERPDPLRSVAQVAPTASTFVEPEADFDGQPDHARQPRNASSRGRSIRPEPVPTMGGEQRRLSFTVDMDVSDDLSIASVKLRATKNSIVNEALRDWLKKYERQAKTR